ncbi:MAG: PqqD family protein [Chloroflexi bacterium]|nr:PqqD family protein [Chloroflexota bacterium]
MISLEKIPVPITGVVGRVLENKEPGKTEAVIVLPNKGQVKVLNEVGARIWSLIDGKRCIREIVDEIIKEYQVDDETAERDTVNFIDELTKKSVVQLI